MWKLTPVAMAALLVGGYSVALAQTELPSVEVRAQRYAPVPLPAGQLFEADLQNLRASTSDTAGLLESIPGVQVFHAGGASGLPVIHGLADDRLRIKVDGMDLLASCPNHMNPALSYLDPSQVGAVVVFAGIVPVSVGGDSIGGSVIAQSKAPEFASAGAAPLMHGELGGFLRSNGNAQGANVALSYATPDLNLTYRASTAKADNYKAAADFKTFTATGNPGRTLATNEVGSSAYETRNQALDLAWRDARSLLEMKLGTQDVPMQLYPNQRMDMLGNKEDRVNLHYLGQQRWGQMEARAYVENVDHFMDFGRDKQWIYGAAPYVVAKGMPMYTQGKTTGLVFKADVDVSGRDLLRLGAEAQAYRLNDWWPPSPSDLSGMLFSAANPVQATFAGMAPDTFWNIRDGKRDRTGVFSEWEAKWSPQWMTVVGARLEQVSSDTGPVQGYNSVAGNPMYSNGYLLSANAFNALDRKRTDNNVDLTLMARSTLENGNTVEFGYAQKTRSPNLYERYSWSRNAMALIMNNFVGDGNGYLGNPDLKPEIARTLSMAATWKGAESQEWKVAPFYTQVSDYIDAVQWDRNANQAAPNTPQQFGILKFANQRATLYGVDISGMSPLGANAWGHWSAKGVLNYTYGHNPDADSGLYNVMPLNAKATLEHKSGAWTNALEWVGVKEKTDVSLPRQEIATPGYSLLNWRSSYSVKQLRIDFGVDNLLNKFYYLPLGGAYSGQGMTMSLNGIPTGIAVPGMGQSAYLGVNYSF